MVWLTADWVRNSFSAAPREAALASYGEEDFELGKVHGVSSQAVSLSCQIQLSALSLKVSRCQAGCLKAES